MTPKLTELIDRAATLTPQEIVKLLTYLQSTPERWDLSQNTIASRNAKIRRVLAQWREQDNEDEQEREETNENRSISSKYAGSLEFSDAEFAAMLKELEEAK
jgi:plasmid maintenance system antidote protein VapI